MIQQPELVLDGEGWHHRIDAIPGIGRKVQIMTTSGKDYPATVTLASPRSTFKGIGSEVAYKVWPGLMIQADQLWAWRYR